MTFAPLRKSVPKALTLLYYQQIPILVNTLVITLS
jgi:hypothetical protein